MRGLLAIWGVWGIYGIIISAVSCMAGCSVSPTHRSSELGSFTLPDPLGKLEKRLLFYPVTYPDGDWNPSGLVFEDAWFESADGTRLHGWYVPHDRPESVILYCHGNAGNITHRASVLRALHDRVNASVLIFDYRGYGRSDGVPNEVGMLADARAARTWLATRVGLRESSIVMMGRSLGGGIAVDLAATDGALALILESTFNNLPDVAASHTPLLPVKMLMRTRLDSRSKIGSYHGPLLQSHGEADRTIPYRLARTLFDAANEPKRFLPFPGADHNDPPPPEYYDTLSAFLHSAIASERSAARFTRPRW